MSELFQPERNRMKHDLLDIYSRFCFENGFETLNGIDSLAEFMSEVKGRLGQSLDQSSVGSLNLLTGTRAQLMFESVLVTLGSVRAIQQLDAGTHWYSEEMQTSDFLV